MSDNIGNSLLATTLALAVPLSIERLMGEPSFTTLAEAIAALSFAPGGVKVFGAHCESLHPDYATDDTSAK
jgi:hypothetical protein